MAESKWESVAVPILEQVAKVEGVGRQIDSGSLAEAIGREPAEVVIELRRLLDADFVDGQDASGFGGGLNLMSVMLTEKGARAVGVWPSSDPYEALIALLDQRILDPSLGEEEKSKLRALRSTIVDVGKTVAGGILAALIKSEIGL